jgi:hypothetical protein
MALDKDEISIAMLSPSDFEAARAAVEGFEAWQTFEDYRSDRDGRLLGLAFAGQRARLTPISLSSFLAWCASKDFRPTAERLEEFAAIVDTLRRNPETSLDPFLMSESRGEGLDHCGPFTVPVNSRSYEQWLACLRESPSAALLEVYAGLLAETWREPPGGRADGGFPEIHLSAADRH